MPSPAPIRVLLSVRGTDGVLRRPVTIWAVTAGEQVYVRTWYRRDSGWYGRALRSGRARLGVDGLEVEVTVEDVGSGGGDLRDAVDAAYRTKYARYGGSTVARMVGDEAAATTLRLRTEQGAAGG